MPTSTKTKKRPVAKKKKAPKKPAKKSPRKAVKKTLQKAVKRSVKRVVKKAKGAAKKKVIAKAKKKAVAKILKQPAAIGKVIHYYGHIGVAIVDVAQPIRLGDVVRVKHGTEDYVMSVTSMQIEHQPVAVAKKNDVIGMKTARKVPQGAVILPA